MTPRRRASVPMIAEPGSFVEILPSRPALDPAIIARLQSRLDAHPKYLAVPVDVADVRAILAAYRGGES